MKPSTNIFGATSTRAAVCGCTSGNPLSNGVNATKPMTAEAGSLINDIFPSAQPALKHADLRGTGKLTLSWEKTQLIVLSH